jgi:hypothetical protein
MTTHQLMKKLYGPKPKPRKNRTLKHVYFGIEYIHTTDHDSIAGYGGRIGYRYKTEVTVQFESKVFNAYRAEKAIGCLVVDIANCLYTHYGFTQTYSPQVDTKARGKNGTTSVSFEYFHNSDEDAIRMGYDTSKGMLRFQKPYVGRSDQVSLDPNNQASYDAMLSDLNERLKK